MRCPACGQSNPPNAAFCLACGTRLPVAGNRPGEERRLVTVMFCDLADFTARSDGADPEDVKQMLRPFHARLQREIERYGGTVHQFLGDGVLAAFGAHTAHEDDPERAVLVALRVPEAIEELNREHGLSLQVRIGIETGEVVVALEPGIQAGGGLTGDVTNTAARLQRLAPLGGAVVGEETYRATESVFRYRELEPVEVKGKGPLRIWQPIASASRLSNEVRRRFRTPLVGRLSELETLEALLLTTIREGRTRFAAVTGPAGIGKTRMVAELARRADDLPDIVRWREGRPIGYGEGVAFRTLTEIVMSETGILETDASGEAERKVRRSVSHVSDDAAERDALMGSLLPLVGIEAGSAGDPLERTDAEREEIFGLWRTYLERLAAKTPLVLVFDDLHVASDPLLSFVDHLFTWTREVPILVLAVGRSGFLARRPDWTRRVDIAVVQVPPLSNLETSFLVGNLLEDSGIAGDVLATVVERSEGVPLYAEEFAQMVRDRGSAASDRPIEVPNSLRGLVSARLDGLTLEERSVVQDAAVIGRVFWTGALEAVSGVDPGRLDPVLDQLVRREVIRRVRPSSVRGEEEFAFWHRLVRDVAYGQIPRDLRAAKHRTVAGWIQQIAADRLDDRVELLAFHLGTALDIVRSHGGPVDDDLLASAIACTLRSADRAFEFDMRRAFTLYQRALAILPPGHADAPRALRGAGVAAAAIGRPDDGEELLLRTIDTLEQRGDEVGRADAMVALSRAHVEMGRMQDVDTLLTGAIAILETQPPGPALARAYARRAGHLLIVGDNQASLTVGRRALELARSLEMGREEILALNYVGAARSILGDPEGIEDLRAAVQRGTELGNGPETATAMNNLAQELRATKGPRTSLTAWEQMTAFSAERGLEADVGYAWTGELESRYELGDWDRVLDMIAGASEWDQRLGGRSIIGTSANLHAGWISLRRGDLQDAERYSETALARARELAVPEYHAPAALLAAELDAALGRREAAIERVAEFEDATAVDLVTRATHLSIVARLLVGLDALDGTEHLWTMGGELRLRDRLSVGSAVAAIHEAQGRTPDAVDMYEQVIDGWSGFGSPLEEAYALLGIARCRAGGDRGVDAAKPAEEAAQLFASLGAAPLERAAIAFAEGAGV